MGPPNNVMRRVSASARQRDENRHQWRLHASCVRYRWSEACPDQGSCGTTPCVAHSRPSLERTGRATRL